jgi:YVTN family beta-propeller protein
VVATVPVGTWPDWGCYVPDKGLIFVGNANSTSVSVISDSTNAVVATVPVGIFPCTIVYDSGTGEIFVTNYDLTECTVSVISDTPSSSAMPDALAIVVVVAVIIVVVAAVVFLRKEKLKNGTVQLHHPQIRLHKARQLMS